MLRIGLAFFILFSFYREDLCYKIENEDKPPTELVWPDEYHFKGNKFPFSLGIREPFEIWFSASRHKSRIDYNGGVQKYFYYGSNDNESMNDTGYRYEIHLQTTEEVTNEVICDRVEFIPETKNFLIDTEDFVYIGVEKIDDQNVYKWSNDYISEELKTLRSIWVAKVKGESDYVIPVKYEEFLYSMWDGNLNKHVLMEYYDYCEVIEDDDLDAEKAFRRKALKNYENHIKIHKVVLVMGTFKQTVGLLLSFLETVSLEVSLSTDHDCLTRDADTATDLMFFDPDITEHVDKAFQSFKNEHNRLYDNHKEHQYRRHIFHRNMERVIMKNRQNLPYKLGINHLADRTKEELRVLTNLKPSTERKGTIEFPYTETEIEELAETLPKEFDLRIEDVITPVKNQGSCGSCWAFSTVAALEGAFARSMGDRAVSLSEQSFIDCSWGFENLGCHGGMLEYALKWALKHGVPTTEDYGLYTEREGYCDIKNMSTNEVFKIKGFAMVTSNSENALKVAVHEHGPVAVAIHASEDFFLYKSGVFYDQTCVGESINHGVTVVGYGVKFGETYWLIKNSWGPNWGEDGYVLLSAKNNNCLTEQEGYYAVV